jgi:hypothetical protein
MAYDLVKKNRFSSNLNHYGVTSEYHYNDIRHDVKVFDGLAVHDGSGIVTMLPDGNNNPH